MRIAKSLMVAVLLAAFTSGCAATRHAAYCAGGGLMGAGIGLLATKGNPIGAVGGGLAGCGGGLALAESSEREDRRVAAEHETQRAVTEQVGILGAATAMGGAGNADYRGERSGNGSIGVSRVPEQALSATDAEVAAALKAAPVRRGSSGGSYAGDTSGCYREYGRLICVQPASQKVTIIPSTGGAIIYERRQPVSY